MAAPSLPSVGVHLPHPALAPSRPPQTPRCARPPHGATLAPRPLPPAPRHRLFRGGTPGGAGARGIAPPLPRTFHAGHRLVGQLRPRSEPVLRSTSRPAVERLHHAQRGQRPADRSRLVAG